MFLNLGPQASFWRSEITKVELKSEKEIKGKASGAGTARFFANNAAGRVIQGGGREGGKGFGNVELVR